MSTANQLLDQMKSWIEQRELCAEKLKKLAKELETLREICNASECVGSTVSVVGALSLIGAGVATVFTAGAAAPLLGAAGAVYAGVGVAVSVVTKITESFISSGTMKEAKKIEEKSNDIEGKIQELFEQLKVEVKKRSPLADPDEVDRLVMAELLGAMARQYSQQWQGDFSGLWGTDFLDAPLRRKRLHLSSNLAVVVVGILAVFAFTPGGKGYKRLFEKGTQQLIAKMSAVGLKTALKGGAKVVGGAVGLAFALPEAIDNWTDMIKKNHVTEASQSLRDTADSILQMTRTLTEQFDDIKKRLQELADVKRCIENSNRSSEDKKKVIEFVKQICDEEVVLQWVIEHDVDFFILVDMFMFLKHELDKAKKKKDLDSEDSEDIDIIFVAHGGIPDSMIPASSLLPLPTIKDVLLYSPWNCTINANVAYTVATGRIKPEHRRFVCRRQGCDIPDDRHQPTNLPNCWNSMKAAGHQMIPNIIVSTLKTPEDKAWKAFEFLQERYGPPGRTRIVIPFMLPGGFFLRVPFYVITFALSLVLYLSRYKATVHLAACLSKNCAEMKRFSARDLDRQYSYTIDNTRMTSSEESLVNRDTNMYRALKAVFG